MDTKGIILAGGLGTRLYPITNIASKQLLPIYDKPMIYYPLATLMLAGIRDILIITTEEELPRFQTLLGNGQKWGLNIHFKTQDKPRGIAEAFILGEQFIQNCQTCLILGDNLFYGSMDYLRRGLSENKGCTIFAYEIENPERYGVVEFDETYKVLSIEEKPQTPKSNYAIPGLYVFDDKVSQIARALKPSSRGELEITDLQKYYLQEENIDVIQIGRGVAWLDTGTPETMLEASEFIRTIEKRQGLKIACLEEIAYNCNYINSELFQQNINEMPESAYKQYLSKKIIFQRECHA